MERYNQRMNFKTLLILSTFSKLFGGEICVTRKVKKKKSLAKLKERQDSSVIFLANALSSRIS